MMTNASQYDSALGRLIRSVAGELRTQRLFRTIEIDPHLFSEDRDHASRAVIAQALTMLLFEETSKRVSSSAQAYVRERVRRGEKIVLDHGAVRTLAAPCGRLPVARAAIVRLIEPLGYELASDYPIDRLFTGGAYRHVDCPETISQFFISEMHPEISSQPCQSALQRIVSSAVDPISDESKRLLDDVAKRGSLPIASAVRLLPNLVACFDRQHDDPALADYELLLSESPDLAWFASEGNVYNHFTDRVADVAAVIAEQVRLGRAIKPDLEISASGRLEQTAFERAQVDRLFVDPAGHLVVRTVPGSFQELITRKEEAPGKLDLGFDTANAVKLIAKMAE